MREQLSTQKIALVNTLLESDTRPNPFYAAVVKKIGTDENLRIVKDSEPGKHYAFYIGTFQQTDKEIYKQRPLRFEKVLVDKLEKELSIDIPEGEVKPKFDVDSVELYAEVIKQYTLAKTRANIPLIGPDDLAEFASAHGILPRRSFTIRVIENAKLMDNGKTRTIRLNTDGIDITKTIKTPVVVTSLNHHMVKEQLLAVINGALSGIYAFVEDISLPATHFVDGNRYTAYLRNTSLVCYGRIEFTVNLSGGEGDGPEAESFLLLNDGTPLKTNSGKHLIIS